MKQVWKCDHCIETNTDPEIIAKHEPDCILNPTYEGCYTCKHSYWYYDVRTCLIDLNVLQGEEGKCKGFQIED